MHYGRGIGEIFELVNGVPWQAIDTWTEREHREGGHAWMEEKEGKGKGMGRGSYCTVRSLIRRMCRHWKALRLDCGQKIFGETKGICIISANNQYLANSLKKWGRLDRD